MPGQIAQLAFVAGEVVGDEGFVGKALAGGGEDGLGGAVAAGFAAGGVSLCDPSAALARGGFGPGGGGFGGQVPVAGLGEDFIADGQDIGMGGEGGIDMIEFGGGFLPIAQAEPTGGGRNIMGIGRRQRLHQSRLTGW